MSENTLKIIQSSDQERSTELGDDTVITSLNEHYEERIDFHLIMLNYYLGEKLK